MANLRFNLVDEVRDDWEAKFEAKIASIALLDDPAHDLLHFKRVVKLAKQLCVAEGGDLNVVIPAAWLHDMIIVPKNNPLRSHASKMSAEAAIDYLKSIGYPTQFYSEITESIAGHSFSANIAIESINAKIVQDADRLDGLGAIGIARCFATSGLLKRAFYSEEDPFCEKRQPDDGIFTVDHFFKKLFKVAESLKTQSGKNEGVRRLDFMRLYLKTLGQEVFQESGLDGLKSFGL